VEVLKISLFGRVELNYDNRLAEVKIPKIAQALLAYMLLKRRRFYTREGLAALFWGDMSEERARSCLNTALWRLRRALEPKETAKSGYVLTASSGNIGFNWDSAYWLDVQIFEDEVVQLLGRSPEALSQQEGQRLQAALELYTGDVLEEFYEDWVLVDRERLRQLLLNGLTQLMLYYKHRGEYTQSLSYGQAILQHDPLRENIHREMMQLYLANNEPVMAIRQYQSCQEVLANELNITPMPETQALYQQIMAGRPETQAELSPNLTTFQQALDQFQQALLEFDRAREKLSRAKQLIEQFKNNQDYFNVRQG
jgi:DNA-binding SARP family transcriptional activator